MKKIAIIGNYANSLFNFRIELIKELIYRGHTVYCIVADFTDEHKTFLKSLGAIPLNHKLNSNGINPIQDIKACSELKNQLLEISPDIVFLFFVKPVVFGSIAAKTAKVPLTIGMIEGLGNAFTIPKEGQSIKTKIIKQIQILLYKFSLPKLDSLILLNKDDKKDLIDKYNIKTKRCVILGGIGVDLNKFSYSPAVNHPTSFIFIARLLREKGIFEYLEAAKTVKERFPQAVFNVLGGFDEENHFALKKAELEKYLDSEIVVYPGHVSNVNDWIAKSSVFVLPSFYREGVPRSTQEAMAIGRPVITTDVPGCRDTVIEGVNGFLIPPFSAEKLAEKMIYFIENPQEIQKMGIESRKIAESDFDISIINEKLCKIMKL